MAKPIMEIRRAKGKFSTCNTCGARADRGTEVHEVELGIGSQSLLVCLCTDCLDKFTDMLWRYQGELS